MPVNNLPDFPRNILAVAGSNSAVISWDAPESNGGSAITGYRIISTPGNNIQDVGPSVYSYTMTGLTNAIGYKFQVFAINANGMSGISSPVTPYPRPSVTKFAAVVTSNTVTLTWIGVPGAVASPITSYTLTCSDSSIQIPDATLNGNNGSSAITIGLNLGVPINFSIYASSAILQSPTINLTNIIPLAYPDSPSNLVAVAKSASVDLSWSEPDFNGGTPLTGYVIGYIPTMPGGHTLPPVQLQVAPNLLSFTVPKLVNGYSYTFTIVAKTIFGLSVTPAESNAVTPYGLPGVPVLTLVAGDSEATLSWTAVPGDVQSPITSYVLTSTPGGLTIPSTITSPLTITGLTNGTSYTFSINSVSATGSSAIVSKTVIPRTIPGSPLNLTAVAKAASALLSWSAPLSNGGSAITGYVLTYGSITKNLPATLLTTTITGLTNGISYTFSLLARNAIGLSASAAESNAVTPYALSGTPVLTVTPGNTEAILSWTATPAVGSSITGYTLSCTNPDVTIPLTITSPLTITGLTNGTSYTFNINSVSDIGSSAIVSKTVIPRTIPSSPSNLTAVAKVASAILSWSAPISNGGSAITGYVLTYGSITKNLPITPLTTTITGLTNGTTYTFSLVARNAAGSSETPVSVTATPYALPGAPVLTLTPGNRQITVSWTAIPAAVESPITSYVLSCTGLGVILSGVNPFIIADLTNGTSYTFKINSVSDIGSSAVVSRRTLVANVPEAPSNLTATAGNASVVLSWTAPSSNGGAPITAYVITSVPATRTVTLAPVILPTTTTISGLTNGTAYTFSIVAKNSMGLSATPSVSQSVTPVNS